MPTQTKENYLKAVFSISQKRETVSITELSEVMQVSKPTVNSMVKKMEEKGWVVYEKYKPLKLTLKGKKVAALIVRKHRLVEMFLSKIMDFGWEEVHDIAEEMEHLQSTKFFDRMDEILGFPTIDPHGSPIPDKTGKIVNPNYLNFTVIKKGEKVKLCGLTNSSKELLLFLNKKNIKLGTELKVQEIELFDKSFEILLNDNQSIILTYDVCKCLLVEPM
ncbi:MAG: metal-dependent transcriptional regulator [Bacteroidetes bacterium]|jgi:DtxR family Mn-dependent transcriptional regulator|nr:metal-dependent transcriptional regulator [Bacteroidota bacterium]